MVPEIDEKSIKNQCKFDARKKDAKNMNIFQNGTKMEAEIEKKSIQKEVRKSMRKKGRMAGGSAARAGAPLID